MRTELSIYGLLLTVAAITSFTVTIFTPPSLVTFGLTLCLPVALLPLAAMAAKKYRRINTEAHKSSAPANM